MSLITLRARGCLANKNMFQCPHCQSELVIRSVSYAQHVRCAQCGWTGSPESGKRSENSQNRAAWWSLWLGLSSILLLSITGIPALILGFRSLLKMRYQKPSKREKEASILGILLGTVFGVLLGGCVMFTGGITLIAMLTYDNQNTNEPEIARQWMNSLVQIDLPQELQPQSASKIKILETQTIITLNNDIKDLPKNLELDNSLSSDVYPNNITILQIYHVDQAPSLTLQSTLNQSFNPILNYDLLPLNTEQLEWNFTGKPIKVIHDTYNYVAIDAVAANTPTLKPIAHSYTATADDGRSSVALRLFTTETSENMSLDKVRRIFESLSIGPD